MRAASQSSDAPRRPQFTLSLCLIFLISGGSSLIFENLWFYQAGIVLGNSVWASSLVLAGFMAGLALGNAVAARRGDFFPNAVRAYAVLEIVIALTGVALVYLLPLLTPVFASLLGPLESTGWLLNGLRFLVSFTLLLAPSTAMGMTLPLLTRALTGADSSFGGTLGRLYAWNTAGAVLGTLAAEVVLIEMIGVRATALTAGSLNLAAAGVAWLLAARMENETHARVQRETWHFARGLAWLAPAFLSGFALLALEVVWFRLLSLYSDNTSFIFSVMLAIVLAGIALGSAIAGAVLRRWPGAYALALPVAFAAGGLCVGSYAALPFAAKFSGVQTARTAGDLMQLALPLMLPVSLLSGVFFTLAGAGLRRDLPSDSGTAGTLTFANTIGAALGALAGGFVLLPMLGVERSLFLLCLTYGTAGLLLFRAAGFSIWAKAAWGCAFVVGAALFPWGSMQQHHIRHALVPFGNPPASSVAIREGTSETILYLQSKRMGQTLYYRMITNSYSMSGTGMMARRYMKLYVYWPAAVHPSLKSALLISYGVGSTAKALTTMGSLKSIDIVDISRDILEMNHIVYPSPSELPLNDPRARVHIEDGRHFLETTKQRFDLITGEPPPPNMAGVVSLYTQEYFQLVYDRLNEGGIATYWLPMVGRSDMSALSIIGAFCGAFEDCSLWNGMGPELMLVGGRNLKGGVSRGEFERQWHDEGVVPELVGLGFERPEQLGALFIGDARWLRDLTVDVPPLIDDFPKRIVAPTKSLERERALFASFRDTEAARDRFRDSPLIARLWPESLAADTIPYFNAQAVINAIGWTDRLNWSSRFEAAHSILSETPLEVLAAWPLSSHLDYQRIAHELAAGDPDNAEVHFHLGLESLGQRDYALAAEHMERAQSSPAILDLAVVIRIFALCMDERLEEAREIAYAHAARPRSNPRLGDYWSWLGKTFGIDPRAGQ